MSNDIRQIKKIGAEEASKSAMKWIRNHVANNLLSLQYRLEQITNEIHPDRYSVIISIVPDIGKDRDYYDISVSRTDGEVISPIRKGKLDVKGGIKVISTYTFGLQSSIQPKEEESKEVTNEDNRQTKLIGNDISISECVGLLKDIISICKFKYWNNEHGNDKAGEIIDSIHDGSHGSSEGIWIQADYAIKRMEGYLK